MIQGNLDTSLHQRHSLRHKKKIINNTICDRTFINQAYGSNFNFSKNATLAKNLNICLY